MSYYPATVRSVYGQSTVKSGDALASAATSGYVTIGTTATNFASNLVLPATSQVAGQQFLFKGMGTYTSSGVGAPTSTISLRMNNTPIFTTAALSGLNTQGTFGYWFEIIGTIVGTGASGSIRCGGILHFATGDTVVITSLVAPMVTSLDTTVNQTLQMNLKYSAVTAGNTNTLQLLGITEIRPPKAAN